ncbi:MAG: hypothetical protein HUJ65_01330, partial [Oscillospiraceae bacterium]|nr:hypothetical protein [Oscillospiraceae bacterium]
IFSLEMPKDALVNRMICRRARINGRILTMRQLTAAADDPSAAEAVTTERFSSLRQLDQILSRIYVRVGRSTAAQVAMAARRHKRISGRAPLVIVDYLQYLAPDPAKRFPSDKAAMDDAVAELVDLSNKHMIPLLVISSYNRASYETAASFTAFKESGLIEYSFSSVLSLDFTDYLDPPPGEGRKPQMELRRESPRRVSVTLLKDRNNETGVSVDYEFHSAQFHFEEIGRHDRPKEESAAADEYRADKEVVNRRRKRG